MKKKDPRRIVFSVVLASALFACIGAFFLPGGAKAAWQNVFRSCGFSDFAVCADGTPFSVHVLDVGKADSIFIECGGKYMLVDGGTADRGADVTAYLKRRNVKSLDYVVNTHPDEDHIGGLKVVLESFPVKRYLAPDIPQKLIPKTPEYAAVQSALKRSGLVTEHPRAGSTLNLRDMEGTVLGPIRPGSDTNNNSIVLRLTYGKTCFLLMGDAGKDEEKSLLEARENLKADMLKVGHHGSNTSTTPEFLQAVRPKYAAISVGSDTNNLPKLDVLKRLADAGASIIRTDVSGTAIFLSDGKSITIKTEKS